MTSHVVERMQRLAGTLAELKIKVRLALASELATALGTAVRDILVVAIIDRGVAPSPGRTQTRPPLPSSPSPSGGWRSARDEERDRWSAPHDAWSEERDELNREAHPASRSEIEAVDGEERKASEEQAPMPTAVALAVGVSVGRWWLARKGTLLTAIGAGVFATALGLAGGPVARAALAVLAAASDVLTAETALARLDHS